MNCRIELINHSNSKTIKTETITGTYAECEKIVLQKNTTIDTAVKKWKLTQINI